MIIPASVMWRDTWEIATSSESVAPPASMALASPKSKTLTVPSVRTLMLAGLRSR